MKNGLQSPENRTAALEERLRAAEEELESFAYAVSHDLRAPLRAIEGFARILTEDYSEQLQDESRRYFDMLIASADKMGAMMDALLAYSRLSRAELHGTEVDMNDLLQALIREQRQKNADRSVSIQLHDVPPARGDYPLLREVWNRLLENAFKFTSSRPEATVEIGGYREGEDLIYYIRDNGVGFQQRYAHKLFSLFQRLHAPDDFPGIGAGLAIVRRIVNRHGGRTWAEGEADRGATFYFSLPANSGD